MGVLDTIRRLLGRDGSDDPDGTDVSVAYDPDDNLEPDESDGEPADVETKTESDSADPETDDASGTDAAAAAETDAAASTDSMTQPTDDPETAAEPAEAGAGVTEHSGTETPAAEPAEATGPVPDEPDADAIDSASDPGDEPDSEPESDEGTEPTEEADSPAVDTVNGIGSAYADRLAAADVETVAQLLEADVGTLAERTDLSEKRIRRWQENATED